MKSMKRDKHLSTAERFAALSRVGVALMSERDEARLLHLIAETACDLTGATFAAFTLRPISEEGQPLVPSEGNFFHLAAVVGVTAEQEELFRRMALGGEGLLAPIFRHGVPVRVADALTLIHHPERHWTREARETSSESREVARKAACDYAHGHLSPERLRSMGVPRGHPIVRSFLGAPLLDHEQQVRGGLLLGHAEPGQFTQEDETLLVGLAAQAAVAIENARLYRTAQMRARQLDAIFESIADGITLVDAQGNILRENGVAHRLRELLHRTADGESLLETLLYEPARFALLDKVVQASTVTMTDAHHEVREYLVSASPLRFPSSTTSPLSQSSDTMSTALSSVGGAVVIWHDVTERRIREAERAARTHAAQLEAIFEAMVDGVFVYDRNGHIVQVNTAGQTFLTQCLPESTLALSLQERISQLVVYTEDGHPLEPTVLPTSRIMRGEVITPATAMDVVTHTVDGHALYSSATGGPLRDAEGNLVGAVLIFRDITERHRLEQLEQVAHAEMEARLALLQLILDELPSSVYLVRGHDARLVLANRATTTVWGAQWPYDQPMHEFLLQNNIRIFGANGQHLTLAELATLRAVQNGETLHQHQEIIRHPDGANFPMLVNAVTLGSLSMLDHLPAGTSSFFPEPTEPVALVVHQDVSALKEAEYLKDEFIGIAAHELRNPLAVLKGFASMLVVQTARGKGPSLADWQQEALNEIEQATLRLDRLTKDLLDVTRLQAGRLHLQRKPTDVVALVQRAITQARMTTEHHQFSVQTSLTQLMVTIDPARIEQVLSNLLTNAIKYSPQGGPIVVTIDEAHEAHMVLFSIRDTGIGISEQQQALLFGRFSRADNALASGISGTGLGLYLCRELVEYHGGYIWLESVEEQGSTFFFSLPHNLITMA